MKTLMVIALSATILLGCGVIPTPPPTPAVPQIQEVCKWLVSVQTPEYKATLEEWQMALSLLRMQANEGTPILAGQADTIVTIPVDLMLSNLWGRPEWDFARDNDYFIAVIDSLWSLPYTGEITGNDLENLKSAIDGLLEGMENAGKPKNGP